MQEEEVVKMHLPSLNGITSKLVSNADKLGYLAAALGSDSTGWNRLNAIISSAQQAAAGVIHAPAFQHEIQNFAQYEGKEALYAWIAGLGLEILDVPIASKFSGALQKGAVSYGLASLAIRLFYSMTHSEIKGTNIESGSPQSQVTRY